MGKVLLHNLAAPLEDALARALHASEAEVDRPAPPVSPEELAVRCDGAEVLVLGTSPRQPLPFARAALARDPRLSVLVIASREQWEGLTRELASAFAQSEVVRCVAEVEPTELLGEIARAQALTRKRRRVAGAGTGGNGFLQLRPLGVSAVDDAGLIVAWNVRAEQFFERSEPQVLGRPFASLLPVEERPAWHALLSRAGELELPERLRLRRVRDDGSPQHLGITAVALGGASGESGLMLLFEDVSERVALEQEQAELFRHTVTALGARDEFLSVASHELRTPLTSLRLAVQSLLHEVREAPLAGVAREQLERKALAADGQVVRLTRLAEGLLDVSSIQAGRLRLERSVVDLAQVVRSAADELSERIARARCEVRLFLTQVKGPWDERRLQQVVMSLLANALRYAPGTTIEVRLRPEGTNAVLEVVDRGIGIDPAELEQIFARFERAAPSRNYGGLGLGLFISRKVVEAHGGTIRADSRPGEGATFRVELPAVTGA